MAYKKGLQKVFIKDGWSRRRLFFTEGMRDKSDDRVGHLNTILAREGGNLNDPICKSSNVRALPGKGGGGGGGDVEVSSLSANYNTVIQEFN